MRNRKSHKSVNKKEDLPSFLLNLKDIPEDIDIPPRTKKSASYLGPIFFGECVQFHPPHRSVPLGSVHQFQYSVTSKENVLKDLFLPKSDSLKAQHQSKVLHPVIKPQEIFVDPYPHRCPGVRRVFAPDIIKSEDLGETKSIIEGEMSREIPFCRVKKVSSVCNPQLPKTEFEVVTLSDLREEKRMFLPCKERMAHAHFPKEFVTVRIIGPTIPEAITITKLPSKRKASFEIDVHLKSKATKTSNKKVEKIKESLKEAAAVAEKKEGGPKESALSILIKKESAVAERSDSVSEKEESEDESGRQQSQFIREKGEDEEEEEEEIVQEGEAAEEEVIGIGEEKENSQLLVDEEKEGASEEENPDEAAKD